MFYKLINRLFLIPRPAKQLLVLLYDFICLNLSFFITLIITDNSISFENDQNSIIFYSSLIFFIFSFYISGFYQQVFRYTNFIYFLFRIFIIFVIHYFLLVIVLYFLYLDFNYSQIILFLLIFYNLVLIGRFLLSSISLLYNKNDNQQNTAVLVYQINQRSVDLAIYLNKTSKYKVIGFLVEKNSIFLKEVNNLPLYDFQELEKIKITNNIKNIFFNDFKNVPNESLDKLNNLDFNLLKIPQVDQDKENNIQNIEVEDLIDRNIYNDKTIVKEIQNKTVLITGAGGSIGSELTKQVLLSNPKSIIAIDSSEYNLFKITQDIKNLISNNKINCNIISLLDNLNDEMFVKSIFDEYEPEIVFHCAAYKHVHIAEENIIQFVKNNIFVTNIIAKTSILKNVEKFVLISTDKAVRPLNIMGASKRIAEKIVLSNNSLDTNKTNFSVVRFGNVLNSSGSVVPIFKKQILNGGPITVTDKNATRYMMLIEEAAYLVLQTLQNKGDIFILNMSKPIKIYDLAKKMIQLYKNKSKSESKEIEIQIIGLKKGEKVHEELLIGDNVVVSSNKDIFISFEKYQNIEFIDRIIDTLQKLVTNNDINSIKKLLFENVEK